MSEKLDLGFWLWLGRLALAVKAWLESVDQTRVTQRVSSVPTKKPGRHTPVPVDNRPGTWNRAEGRWNT